MQRNRSSSTNATDPVQLLLIHFQFYFSAISTCKRLKLEVVVAKSYTPTTTTSLVLPKELPSVEEALKILVAAMKALETPDLSKTEVLRLRSIIQAAGVY